MYTFCLCRHERGLYWRWQNRGDPRVLSNDIYEELRRRICFLVYPPGTRLGEVELAEEFGVSRTPIREALGHLEAQGLVKAKRGVGTIVTEIDPATLLQTYELRKELSMLLTRLSPVTDMQNIARTIEPLRAEARTRRHSMDVTEFARLNTQFFQAMLLTTTNEPLRDMCEKLYFMTARLWMHSIPRLSLRDEIQYFIDEMDDVYSALIRNDLSAIGHIRWLHIAESIKRQRERSAL